MAKIIDFVEPTDTEVVAPSGMFESVGAFALEHWKPLASIAICAAAIYVTVEHILPAALKGCKKARKACITEVNKPSKKGTTITEASRKVPLDLTEEQVAEMARFVSTVHAAPFDVVFDPEWNNGTGYFDPLVHVTFNRAQGDLISVVDDYGRDVLICVDYDQAGEASNEVFFSRYNEGPLVLKDQKAGRTTTMDELLAKIDVIQKKAQKN